MPHTMPHTISSSQSEDSPKRKARKRKYKRKAKAKAKPQPKPKSNPHPREESLAPSLEEWQRLKQTEEEARVEAQEQMVPPPAPPPLPKPNSPPPLQEDCGSFTPPSAEATAPIFRSLSRSPYDDDNPPPSPPENIIDLTAPKCPKVLARWTYTGSEGDKNGREYVLTDDFFGGIVGRSDTIAEMGSFGQVRVEGADDRGFLHVLILDPMHLAYEQCATVPPEGVYLCGNGNMEMILPEDYNS